MKLVSSKLGMISCQPRNCDSYSLHAPHPSDLTVHQHLHPHLYIHSIPAFVLTLHHLWGEDPAACRASDTLELRDGAGAPRCSVAAPVQSQYLDIPQ